MRILIAEDEPALSSQIADALVSAGYVVETAVNGEDAQYVGEFEAIDLAILDLGLPKIDGLTVLRRWRVLKREFPVLILTARSDWSEKVEGIDAGADDYLSKPFHVEELLARVRALLRRKSGLASAELTCGALRLDTRSGKVSVDGVPVALTAQEYKILAYLMHRPGDVISRTELTEHIYSQDFDRDSNTIEVFIGRLRRKIGIDCIETLRGRGYRLRQFDGRR